MHRRVYLAAVGTAATAGVAGCTSPLSAFGDGTEDDGDAYDVGMNRNEFLPSEYEVSVGETVVWKNTSGADHTVTAYENGIPEDAAYFATGGYDDEATAREAWETRGGRLGTRETFEHTFDVPGRYDYVCIPHERGGMVGTVVVTE